MEEEVTTIVRLDLSDLEAKTKEILHHDPHHDEQERDSLFVPLRAELCRRFQRVFRLFRPIKRSHFVPAPLIEAGSADDECVVMIVASWGFVYYKFEWNGTVFRRINGPDDPELLHIGSPNYTTLRFQTWNDGARDMFQWLTCWHEAQEKEAGEHLAVLRRVETA